MRATVVLPEPDSPTTASDSPGAISNDTVIDRHELAERLASSSTWSTGSAMRPPLAQDRELLGAHAATTPTLHSPKAGRAARQRSSA